MIHLRFTATDATDHVMVSLPGDLIGEMTVVGNGRTYQPHVSQKLQGAIYRWLGETRMILFRLFVDFSRREVRALMAEYMQDCQTLRRHSVSTGAQLRSIFGSTG